MTECHLCGKDSGEHRDLEARGILNHRFSESGDLTPVDKAPKATPKPPREVMVLPSVDLLLRQLLVKKGILSETELAELGAFGTVDRGDISDRPPTASD